MLYCNILVERLLQYHNLKHRIGDERNQKHHPK